MRDEHRIDRTLCLQRIALVLVVLTLLLLGPLSDWTLPFLFPGKYP